MLLLLHGLDDGGSHILKGHFALVGDDEDREAVWLLHGTDDLAGFGSEYLAAQNVVFEVEAALPAEVAALLGGVAVVGEFARHCGKAVGAAQSGEHLVNGGWPAGEDAAQAALLADAVLLKVLAGLVAAYVLGDSDHAATVHFVEDEFLFSLCDLAFDLKSFSKPSWRAANSKISTSMSRSSAWRCRSPGAFLGKSRAAARSTRSRVDVDVADAGEDIWVRRGFGRGTGEE